MMKYLNRICIVDPMSLPNFIDTYTPNRRQFAKKLSIEKDMTPLTDAEKGLYRDAMVCRNCHNNSDSKSRVKTRHHCDTTGRFIGPVCASCNLQLKYRKRNRTSDDDRELFLSP